MNDKGWAIARAAHRSGRLRPEPATLSQPSGCSSHIADDGSVETAAQRLAWHYDNPPQRPDILGDFISNVWGRPRT